MSELRLKELLRGRGMTQAQLARKMGIAPTTLSRTLSNDNLSMATLRRIAQALGCTVGELFTPAIRCPYCGKEIRIDKGDKI